MQYDVELIERLGEVAKSSIYTDEAKAATLELLDAITNDDFEQVLAKLFVLLSEVASSAVTMAAKEIIEPETLNNLIKEAHQIEQDKIEEELQAIIRDQTS